MTERQISLGQVINGEPMLKPWNGLYKVSVWSLGQVFIALAKYRDGAVLGIRLMPDEARHLGQQLIDAADGVSHE